MKSGIIVALCLSSFAHPFRLPTVVSYTKSTYGVRPLFDNAPTSVGALLSGGEASCELATEGAVRCTDTQDGESNDSPPPSVWTVFGEIAAKTGASNLGQGFPDWSPPAFLLDALRLTADTSFHQYTRPAGHPPLIELLAKRYSAHLNRPVDPYNELSITVGASQALFLALSTLLKPSDEVVMFEPFFDLYLKQIKLCQGAKARFVALGGAKATAEDPWALDVAALEASITPKTRVLILNSPHNPTGKVFTRAEFEAVADIVRRHPQLVVLSDEVYKFSVYDALEDGDPTSRGHYHFARLPGMFDRTITLSSCGKTFSATGWQVGWMVGPAHLVRPVQELLPCVQFCASTPVQHALYTALKSAELPFEGSASYYEWLRAQFASKRALLEEGLRAAGMTPLPSRGGFFLMARLPAVDALGPMDAGGAGGAGGAGDLEPYDWRYCRMLASQYGVIGIPASPFFSSSASGALQGKGPMARFAFCKKDETLREATRRLKNPRPWP